MGFWKWPNLSWPKKQDTFSDIIRRQFKSNKTDNFAMLLTRLEGQDFAKFFRMKDKDSIEEFSEILSHLKKDAEFSFLKFKGQNIKGRVCENSASKCFCGRTDIASQIALDYPICTYHNIVYVYNPKKFEEIVKLYKALTCTCFKYAQSFDSEGRCQTCGRINQEVKKELDDFNGKT